MYNIDIVIKKYDDDIWNVSVFVDNYCINEYDFKTKKAAVSKAKKIKKSIMIRVIREDL